MSKFKRLSPQAIHSALEKAERYRFLNEPAEAESICLDILTVEPQNQKALVILLLALTDRVTKDYMVSASSAEQVVQQLSSAYDKAYYSGIILERKAKAKLEQHSLEAGYMAFELLQQAMNCYEQAEALRPTGNDDALLRWNTCARIIDYNHLTPKSHDEREPFLE